MRLKLGDFKNGMASFLKPTWNNKWIEKMNCIQKLKVPALLRLGHSKAHVLAAYVSHSLLPLTLAEDSYGYPPSTCQPTMAACINMYTYINTYIHICIYAYEYLYLSLIYIYIYSIANTTTPKSPWSTPSNESNVWNGPISSGCDHFDDKTSMFAGSIPGAPVFVLIFAGKCWWLPWIFAGQILTNPYKTSQAAAATGGHLLHCGRLLGGVHHAVALAIERFTLHSPNIDPAKWFLNGKWKTTLLLGWVMSLYLKLSASLPLKKHKLRSAIEHGDVTK